MKCIALYSHPETISCCDTVRQNQKGISKEFGKTSEIGTC